MVKPVRESDRKECTRCRVVQPYENFGSLPVAPDKRQYWCRACQSAYAVERRAKAGSTRRVVPARSTTGKECTKCQRAQSWEAFARLATSTDGHQTWCRECVKDYDKRRKAARAAQRSTGLTNPYTQGAIPPRLR